MPATIRASHKRLLVLLLVAALLSAVSASAHLPQPTAPRLFSVDHARLDLAWAELELSQKPRLGDLRAKNAFRPPGNLCKSLNALVDSSALRSNPDRNVFFFQGRERDPATGLYDFRNRWYDANLARFVSFDPKPYVDGPNAYGGFVGNPVTMSDPTGEFVPLLAMIGMGMLNVGFGAAVNHTFGDGDYSLMDAAQDFTIGALSGGLGTLTKGSKMLTVAAEVGVGALDSQVRSVRETGELMNFTDSVNQGAIGTLTGRVGARALGGAAKPVFKAISKVTGVATSRLGKVLSHLRGNCNSFVAKTPVLTDDGLVPIEQIRAGDYVLAWSAEAEEVVPAKVVATMHHTTGELVRLTVDSETFGVTAEHPFWVVDEDWVDAGALRIGDIVVDADGRARVVEGIDFEATSVEVYNLEVEGLHTYFVGQVGAWVHNARCPQVALNKAVKRHGGIALSLPGHYQFPTRRAARSAAAEVAGDLGPNPITIRKRDYRGGPPSWRNSNGVIGKKRVKLNQETGRVSDVAGWRDDLPGHIFKDGVPIGPHVNVKNEHFKNLHFMY